MTGRHRAERPARKIRTHAKVAGALSLAVLALSAPTQGASPLDSGAIFGDSQAVAANALSADTLKPPTGMVVASLSGGITKLGWNPSASTYATGYRVLRAASSYGPWDTIGTTVGRSGTAFTDNTSGATSWYYRVETTANNWVSTGQAYEAPDPVGREFFDTFEGSRSKLDGRVTGDGLSKWLVWAGAADAYVTSGAAYGVDGMEAVAVVRTPSNSGVLYAEDFDGFERFVLRGKDPKNYIYAGGTGEFYGFELVQVKNGQKTVLKSIADIGMNQNIRAEATGNTIAIYKDAVRGKAGSGTLLMSVNTTHMAGDPAATYFGIGWTKAGFGINDFTFSAR